MVNFRHATLYQNILFYLPLLCKKENKVACPPRAGAVILAAEAACFVTGASSSEDSARNALGFFKLGAAASARALAAAAASCARAIATKQNELH
jgi:hypothetical protein